MKNERKNKGITLISLVITIIVLLILAGVAIATLTGENGILSKASNAKDESKITTYEEEIKLEALDEQAERKYKQKEEVFIESLENRIKQKDWIRDTYICDAQFTRQEEMEKNILLIINTTDGYQIIIDVDNTKLSLVIRDTTIIQGDKAIIEYNSNGGTGTMETQEISIGNVYSLIDNKYKKDSHLFLGWCEDKEGNGKRYLPNEKILINKEKIILYAIWMNQNFTADSIIQGVEKLNQSGYYQINTNNIQYKIHLYYYNESQEWTNNMTFGDANDVGTASTNASRMVVVKVDGNLTINSGVVVQPYFTNYGGPKGFLMYCTGTLTNNGTIANNHGAKAVGENVYLWKSDSGVYQTVDAKGGAGAGSVKASGYYVGLAGLTGGAGTGRKTGGGGSGASSSYNTFSWNSGAGATGTSYSGGTGGARCFWYLWQYYKKRIIECTTKWAVQEVMLLNVRDIVIMLLEELVEELEIQEVLVGQLEARHVMVRMEQEGC